MGDLMPIEGCHQHALEAPDRAVVSLWLDELAVSTGDRRFRHAASILRSPPAGRPACADDPLVIETQWLVDTGRANAIETAARMLLPRRRIRSRSRPQRDCREIGGHAAIAAGGCGLL